MTWTLSPVRATSAGRLWDQVVSLLIPAIELAHGRMSAETVFDWIEDGRYMLWVAHQEDLAIAAAFVTREAQYPLKRMLTIDLAGGKDMSGWLDVTDKTFRAHARNVGLDGVELAGRSGWTRALEPFGWNQSGVIVETDVGAA